MIDLTKRAPYLIADPLPARSIRAWYRHKDSLRIKAIVRQAATYVD